MVAKGELGTAIDIERLAAKLPSVIYEPEQFPGSIYYADELEGASILMKRSKWERLTFRVSKSRRLNQKVSGSVGILAAERCKSRWDMLIIPNIGSRFSSTATCVQRARFDQLRFRSHNALVDTLESSALSCLPRQSRRSHHFQASWRLSGQRRRLPQRTYRRTALPHGTTCS